MAKLIQELSVCSVMRLIISPVMKLKHALSKFIQSPFIYLLMETTGSPVVEMIYIFACMSSMSFCYLV